MAGAIPVVPNSSEAWFDRIVSTVFHYHEGEAAINIQLAPCGAILF